MTTRGYASMYSGLPNPERVLTEEEVSKVKEMMSRLDEPWTEAHHPKMGFTGYGAWNGKENWYVSVDFRGFAAVWTGKRMELDYFKDTVGLTTYLQSILKATVDRHFEDAQELMQDFVALWPPRNL